MKFSLRQFPILNNLDNHEALVEFQDDGLINKFTYDPDCTREGLNTLYGVCYLVVNSKTIEYVSLPFFEKVISEKIYKKLSNLYSEIEPCKGILLFPKKYSQ
jgi:hypothetical protein